MVSILAVAEVGGVVALLYVQNLKERLHSVVCYGRLGYLVFLRVFTDWPAPD